ncbi:diguanylate cyclase [Pseudomaricurvus alkylphenolicus]|jgi:diguanylate cyclase (GGDEF)-like protein|uniref:GGDEF domain-containing response regulator n=1 Tax=Pseudomaricurvus alkylphenolicus TaxID=1306991 RepID=UPI00141EB1F5|nr:diguanylate cyclase [Pseudomaricurvus alkylphenolicus]NIB41969.1 diguanylate cyclase [Pseudomaricurvus alkylphenolicus]
MAKILVVDDIEDNITLLCFNLEDDGHQVLSARSGEQCLQITADEHPDLILLDLMMPGMSGTETLTHLQASAESRNIPVIMVSANDDDDSIIDALDVGAYDYVTKPFIYPVLAARMRSALRLQESQRQLREANSLLARLASLDPLTEVYNRRHFLHLANAEFAKARRHGRPVSLIMLDVDKFKGINDKYGHPGGDQALIALTDLCKEVGRSSEIVGRFGGEEFAICCPDTDAEGVLAVAERLRSAAEQHRVCFENNHISFTISLGTTTISASDQDFDEMLRRADRLLYQAKEQGRNRVCGDMEPA